jgi:peptidoglycan hydrolase CwlO-like protein
MSENLVLDKSLASASGVALIRNGEVVEFFPQTSGDLGLSGDEIVLTESDETKLTEALRDFVAEIKIVYRRMDETQAEIERLSAKSTERQKRIDASLERIEGLFQ